MDSGAEILRTVVEFGGNRVFIVVRDEGGDAGSISGIPIVGDIRRDPIPRQEIELEMAEAAAGSATSVTAAYLPACIGIPIDNRSAWWAAATTTATNSRVTIIVSKDEE